MIGIRPEHLEISDPDGAVISGAVAMVEQLGADMLIHIEHGTSTVIARLPQGPQPEIGAHVHFSAPASRVFLFDATSGERIR